MWVGYRWSKDQSSRGYTENKRTAILTDLTILPGFQTHWGSHSNRHDGGNAGVAALHGQGKDSGSAVDEALATEATEPSGAHQACSAEDPEQGEAEWIWGAALTVSKTTGKIRHLVLPHTLKKKKKAQVGSQDLTVNGKTFQENILIPWREGMFINRSPKRPTQTIKVFKFYNIMVKNLLFIKRLHKKKRQKIWRKFLLNYNR